MGRDFGSVGLQTIGALAEESSNISGNWPALGGTVSLESARLQMSKPQKIQEINKHD